MDAAPPRAAARRDGTVGSHRHDERLTPTALAVGYQQRPRVEAAWRTLTSGLRLRPVCPGALHRLHAHVAWRVLAWLWARLIEQTWGDTWRNRRADLEPMQWAPWSSPPGEIWQVTAPSAEVAQRLQCLEIKNPPAVIPLT
jgi:hypothetical protein